MPERQGVQVHRRHAAGTAAARVTDHARAVQRVGGGQHRAAFGFVGRRHDHHVGNAGDEGQVEGAVVRRAIGADQAAAVDRENDRQILQRDVVDQLVVGALQEGRVDGDDRLQAFAGEAGGEGDGMLLGDADIEIAIRECLGEAHQAGAFAHGRGDADQPLSALAMSHSQSPKTWV